MTICEKRSQEEEEEVESFVSQEPIIQTVTQLLQKKKLIWKAELVRVCFPSSQQKKRKTDRPFLICIEDR